MEKAPLPLAVRGPMPYPPELGKPTNGDWLPPPGYPGEVVILEDPGLPALCCATCRPWHCPAGSIGLRLERRLGGLESEAGKPSCTRCEPGTGCPAGCYTSSPYPAC